MNSMKKQPVNNKFEVFQNVYFKVTLYMLGISALLLIFSVTLAFAVVAAPLLVLYFALFVMYYHLAHFGYGVMSLIYFYVKISCVQ